MHEAPIGHSGPDLEAGQGLPPLRSRSRSMPLAMDHLSFQGWFRSGRYGWRPRPDKKSLRAVIRDTIHQVAERGQVVIVAHAASFALGPRPGVLRVLVTASPEVRAERLHRLGLTQKDAESTIEESDRSRRQYLETFYGVHEETPASYDLVINTDRVSLECAIAPVVACAGY